jgi:hypothetical protein
MALVQALRAEALKLRRTLALWMALLAPLLIEVLDFILYFQRGYIRHDVENPWLWLGQQTLVYWSLLMLPLIITLQTALLANVEHSNQQWKHLFVLPTPRGAIYAAKQIAAMVLVGFSTLSLLALTVLNGLLLRSLESASMHRSPGGSCSRPLASSSWVRGCSSPCTPGWAHGGRALWWRWALASP